MKRNLLIATKLTVWLLLLCAVVYPLLVFLAGMAFPGAGDGRVVKAKGRIVGYINLGQKFDQDIYFWSRPSAVSYNAAGSGGSNKGATNPDYLKDVQAKIDTFRKHNPTIPLEKIPSELVTNSGSGLDPDISPEGAYVQVPRIARSRNIPEAKIKSLVESHIQKPLWGLFGPSKINVLRLNVDLDQISLEK